MPLHAPDPQYEFEPEWLSASSLTPDAVLHKCEHWQEEAAMRARGMPSMSDPRWLSLTETICVLAKMNQLAVGPILSFESSCPCFGMPAEEDCLEKLKNANLIVKELAVTADVAISKQLRGLNGADLPSNIDRSAELNPQPSADPQCESHRREDDSLAGGCVESQPEPTNCGMSAMPTSSPPTVTSETTNREGWHYADSDPPSDYAFGPITGKKAKLAKWIFDSTDARRLRAPIAQCMLWGRKEHTREYSVWFRSEERYNTALSRSRL